MKKLFSAVIAAMLSLSAFATPKDSLPLSYYDKQVNDIYLDNPQARKATQFFISDTLVLIKNSRRYVMEVGNNGVAVMKERLILVLPGTKVTFLKESSGTIWVTAITATGDSLNVPFTPDKDGNYTVAYQSVIAAAAVAPQQSHGGYGADEVVEAAPEAPAEYVFNSGKDTYKDISAGGVYLLFKMVQVKSPVYALDKVVGVTTAKGQSPKTDATDKTKEYVPTIAKK